MFNHILLPTDGDAISTGIVRDCIALARSCGAIVTGIHVIPEFRLLDEQTEVFEARRAEYLRLRRERAMLYLSEIEQVAAALHVPCNTVAPISDYPYEAIIAAAHEQGCDLICMASHGGRGVKGLLLGSEAQKVLTHSQIPVLVLR
ncbi:universal stress protein [Oxalobacteraceae bacterium]|nr:universal stress protein [Oxalobacteraceae bacterium]